MQFLTDLWMPIVAAGLFALVASFLVHMALPIHKGEWGALPDEAKVGAALGGVPAGQYMLPCPGSMADMKSPEFIERMKKGPNGHIVVRAGMVNMGKNVGLMFLYFLVVSIFVAYVGWHSIPKGTHYLEVFRVCGTVAFMAYGLGWIPNQIWYGGSTKAFWTYLFDGILYALLTAGTFGWLWMK